MTFDIKKVIHKMAGIPWDDLKDVKTIRPPNVLEYVITKRDIKKSIPGDPFHCVHSTAIQRTTGAVVVYFGRAIAYLLVRNADGKLELNKYSLWKADREVAKKWDIEGEAETKAVKLHPLTDGRSAEAVAEREQKKRKQFKKLVELGATTEEAKEIQERQSRIKKRPKRRIKDPSDNLWRPAANATVNQSASLFPHG